MRLGASPSGSARRAAMSCGRASATMTDMRAPGSPMGPAAIAARCATAASKRLGEVVGRYFKRGSEGGGP
jgi:hypothetical protein